MAAAIGMPHPKWGERPLLVIEVSDNNGLSQAALLEHIALKLPKWWVPDEVRIIDAIPLGATGKVDKKALRGSIV